MSSPHAAWAERCSMILSNGGFDGIHKRLLERLGTAV